jgi:hypothetical protein
VREAALRVIGRALPAQFAGHMIENSIGQLDTHDI